MKRIVALIVAGLMMAIISPVVMAANLDFKGTISSNFGYYEEIEGSNAPTFHGDANLSLEASLGENLKAGFSLNGMERFFHRGWTSDKDVTPYPAESSNITLNKVWLEAKGAIIPDAPEMTTRIGGLDVNYSPYVADGIGSYGISVDGLAVGPVSVGGFYAWNPTSIPTDTAATIERGGYVKVAPVQGMEVKGTLVQVDEGLSYAVEGNVAPMNNLAVTAGYAVDQDGDQAYKVDGKLQLMPNLEVRAGYRDLPRAFNAARRETDTKIIDFNDAKGFSVGATTTQLGVKLAGDYGFYNNTLEFSATRGLELAGMNFNTKLAGKYNTVESNVTALDATVDYNAPNGMAVSAGYDFINKQPMASVGLSLKF